MPAEIAETSGAGDGYDEEMTVNSGLTTGAWGVVVLVGIALLALFTWAILRNDKPEKKEPEKPD